MGLSVSINENEWKIFYSYHIIVFYYHSYDYCDNIHSTDRLSSGLLFVMFVEKSLAIGYGTDVLAKLTSNFSKSLILHAGMFCLTGKSLPFVLRQSLSIWPLYDFQKILPIFDKIPKFSKNSQGTSLKVRDLILWILALYMRMRIWAPVKTKFANSI